LTIKELREKNKLTQTALARSLGVTSNAVSAIESGRLKLSEKLSYKIKEVYGEVIEPETKKAKSAKKIAEKRIKAAEEKAKDVIESTGAEAVLEVEKKIEKKTRQRKAKVQAAKPSVEASAEAVEGVASSVEEKIGKKAKRVKKANLVIQSPMGGEITPDAILAKIGEADTVYVRVDQNKAYWVKGEEAGSVDLW
jgi:Predicted transcriptional regulators